MTRALGSDSLQKVALVRNAQTPGDSAQHPLESPQPGARGTSLPRARTPHAWHTTAPGAGPGEVRVPAALREGPARPNSLRPSPPPQAPPSGEGPRRPSPAVTREEAARRGPRGSDAGSGGGGRGLKDSGLGRREPCPASRQTTPEAGARKPHRQRCLLLSDPRWGAAVPSSAAGSPGSPGPHSSEGRRRGIHRNTQRSQRKGLCVPGAPQVPVAGVCPQPVPCSRPKYPGKRRAGLESRASVHRQSRGQP